MDENRLEPMMPEPGMCGCDRDVFERVWKRVMPDSLGEGPIQLMPLEQREQTGKEPPQTGLALPMEQERICTCCETRQPETLCLGQGSAHYASLLQEMVDGEMEDWRLYQMLARRAAGNGGKMLGSMAADERRHARRLSTAYFLITGERCQPRGQEGTRPTQELMNTLREQFIQEQREAAAYQAAAAENSDPCLRQLFRELAQEEGMHARMIRSLLEQM